MGSVEVRFRCQTGADNAVATRQRGIGIMLRRTRRAEAVGAGARSQNEAEKLARLAACGRLDNVTIERRGPTFARERFGELRLGKRKGRKEEGTRVQRPPSSPW